MKLIQDSTWSSPLYPQGLLITAFLIIITLFAESGIILLYANHKGYKDLGELLLIVVALNFLTGLFGFALGMLL